MKVFNTYIKQSVAAVFALLVGFQSYGQTEITNVTFAESSVESININSASGTVSITVGYGGGCTSQSCFTDALTPTFTLSSGASIFPASGVVQNFTNGSVSYMVTGSGTMSPPQKTWLVSVSEGQIPCNGQDITSFTIPNQVGTSVIDNSANTISVTMPAGTDVSALVPTFSSEGSASPSSGVAQNFSSPFSYTVVDTSCSDQKTWTVTVTLLNPLIAQYDFSGDATDSSGNGYDGTLGDGVNANTFPTLVSDRFGNTGSAYSFDGIDDNILLPSVELVGGTQTTISGWVYVPDSHSTTQMLFSSGGNLLYVQASGIPTFTISSLSGPVDVFSSQAIAVNQWYFVVGVYEGSEAKLYVDGELVGSVPTSSFTIETSTNNKIGENGSIYSRSTMDDIKIYSTALTQSEIQALYAEGGWPLSTLQAQYLFSGNFNDETGNGNNGTGFGAPALAVDRFGNLDQAYTFFGTGQYVRASGISGTPHITLSSWFNTSGDYSTGYANFIEIAGGAGLGINDANQVNASMQLDSGNFTVIASQVTVNDDFWHLATTTYDGSVMILYLDGDEVARTDSAGSVIYFNDPTDLNIGYSNPGVETFFEGTLDDLAFYSSAIDSTEVAALYSVGNFSSPITKIGTATITAVDGFITDSGGSGANYADNEDLTTTITTGIPGQGIVLEFASFDTELNFDYLYIYDGLDANAPLIDTYTGNTTDGGNIPQTVVATNVDGALTLVFTSNANVTAPGWVAEISTQALTIPDLVAQYDMDGNGNDATGNGNNGTTVNVNQTNNRFVEFPGAYNFNGTNTYINAPDSWQFDVGNNTDFAISGWFRADQTSGVLFDKSDGSVGYIAQILSGGQLQFFMVQGASSSFVETTTTWNDDLWHHFVMQVDRDAGIQIFVDGFLENSNAASTVGINPDTSEDFLIGVAGGVSNAGLNTFITADLDDFKVYSRTLSTAEVFGLYDEGGWNALSSRIAYFTFDSTAIDNTGGTYNGTVVGAVSSEDRFGNTNASYQFNGIDQFISLPTTSVFVGLTSAAINGWILMDAYPPEGPSAQVVYDPIIDTDGLAVRVSSNGNLQVYLNQGGFDFFRQSTDGTIPLGVPTMFSVVKTDTDLEIYINGVLEYTSVGGIDDFSGSITSNSATKYIGRSDTTYFKGNIDDLSLYNDILTPSEIEILYGEGKWPSQNVSAVSLSIEEGSPSSGGTVTEVGMSQINLQGIEYWDLVREFTTAESVTFQVTEGTAIKVYGESGTADLVADLDGVAIPISADGLYNVRYNTFTKAYHIYKINSVGFLGSARTGDDTGWLNPNDNMLQSGNTSGVYYLHDIVLFDGAWKMQANDDWDVINWGDDEVSPDGTLELFGGDIPVLAGSYDIVVDLINSTYDVSTALTAPTGLFTYTLSESQIELQWDDATGETGYRIYRSTDDANFIEIATLSPDITNYVDNGLVANTVYYYYVESYNTTRFESSNSRFDATFSSGLASRFQTFNTYGGTGYDYGRSVAVDPATGDYYFYGEFTNEISFGSSVLTAQGQGLFLVKFSGTDGSVIWSRSYDTSDPNSGLGYAFSQVAQVAPDGTVVITGWYGGILNGLASPEVFGDLSDVIDYKGNLFVIEVDGSTGADNWTRTLNTTGESSGSDIAFDNAGNIYVAGRYEGSATFASIGLGGKGTVLLKYDPDGNEIWAQTGAQFDESVQNGLIGIVSNSVGDTFHMVGTLRSEADFSGSILSLTAADTVGVDFFTVSYDINGNLLNQDVFGGPSFDGAFDVAIDNSDQLYLTGYFTGPTLSFEAASATNRNPGTDDIFVMKYDPGVGSVSWIQSYGSTGNDLSLNMVSDGTDLYMTGFDSKLPSTFGSFTVDNGTFFLTKILGIDGSVEWVDRVEGSMRGRGLTYDNGLLFVPGRWEYVINVGGAYSSANSSSDVFLATVDLNAAPTGLVGYYTFDNGSVADQSGNGYDGSTPNGALFSTDRYGNPQSSFEPENNASYVEVSHNGSWDFTGAFTIAAWVRPNTFTTGSGNGGEDRDVLFHDDGSGFWIQLEQGRLVWNWSSGSTSYTALSRETIDLNLWNYISISVNADNQLIMSVNGELLAFDIFNDTNSSQIAANVTGFTVSPNTSIGNKFYISFLFSDSFVNAFNGDIDDVRIYTGTSLDETALLAIYQEELSGGADRLVAEYAFDLGDLSDISGNAYNDVVYRDVNGTVISPPPFLDAGVDGTADGALSFINDGSYVDVFHESTINLDRNFTVNIWVHPYALPEAGRFGDVLFSDGAGARLMYSPEGRVFYHADGDMDINSADAIVQSNVWQMVTYSIDNSDRLKIYHDGSLVAEGFLSNPIFTLSDRFTVGLNDPNTTDDGSGDRYLNAKVDDLSVYQRVLTDQEIAEIYLQSDDRLFAYYPFNGNSVDESGNGFDATALGSPTLSQDRFGNDGLAYSFNGSTDYLTVPSVTGPLNATVSLWFNTVADYSAGFVNMVELNGGIGLGINELNQASIAMQLAPDVFTVLTSDQSVNDGKWHFLAATYNGASLVLYLDGTEIGRNEENTGNILYLFEPTDLNIGLSASNSSYFSGSLDEIRLYEEALSATEIESVYNAEKPVNNLLAEYNFSGNLSDESGNGKDITVNNAAFGVDRFGTQGDAVTFNGSQNLQGPAIVTETLNQASYVGWINPLNIFRGGAQVIAEQRATNVASWQWEVNQDGSLYYTHWAEDGIEHFSSTTNGGVFPIAQNNLWYHVAVVWTGNEAIHYVDGQEVYRNAMGGNISSNATATYYGSDAGGGESLEGTIDELKFYRIALSSTEIFDIFQNEAPSAPDAPSNPSVLVYGPDAIRIYWADNSNNETSFDVTVLQSGAVFSSTPVNADGTNLIVTGLQTDIEYEIYVEAVNGIGKSASTASVFATPILLADPAVSVFPAIFSLDEPIDITVDVNRLYPPGVFTASSILYLHSGLIEPGFENRGSWVAAPDNSFETDNGVGQMTSNGDGTFTITIADPRTYYGVDTGFVASQIGMLFRGADGTKVGRGAWNTTNNTGDIFIDVFDATNISRPFGKSAAFNGAQSLQTQQPLNPQAWATQSQFTVEYWMNIAAFPAELDDNYMFERFTNGLEGLAFRSGLFTSAGIPYLETWMEDGQEATGTDTQRSTIQLDDSYLASWVHVATTYDGSTVTVYINGEQALSQTVTIAYPSVAGPNEILRVGEKFSGKLDELRFWGTALSSDAIKSSLGSILSGNEIGLQGYWRFEEFLADDLGNYSPDLTLNDNGLYGEAAVPSGQPDLSGGVLTVNGIGVNESPLLFLQDRNNTVVVEITNRSPAEAAAIGPVTNLLYFSQDQFFDGRDQLVSQRVDTLNIPVGGVQNVQFDFTLFNDTPSGIYYLFSLIDSEGEVDELDELNNDFNFQVRVSNLEPLSGLTGLSNSSSSFTSLSFSWTAVTDANNYVYQLASDDGFASIIASSSTVATTTEISSLELNTTYFFRVKAQNTNDGRETDYVQLSTSTNEDVTDPVVASISPGNSDVSEGDAVEITVTVTDNFAIEYVHFYKRTAGTADFSNPQVEFATETSGSVSFVFSLQATDFDNIGAVVAVQAFDRAGLSSGISQSVSYTIQVSPNDEIPVSSTEKPEPGSGVTAYSIFAFPFQSKSLGLVITAPADPAVWVVREYTGSGTSPYRTPSSLTAGRGYWFLSDDPTVFPSSFSGVSSPSLVNGAYEIALTSGWNMIGNPSNLGAMDWTDVINYNIANNPDITSASDISQLYKYTGTGATNGYTTANTLNRFEGAFVESNVGAVTLLVPATALTGARVDDALAAPRDYLRISGGWEFVMDMQVQGQVSYGIAGFGAHPDALDEIDNFDLSTPILFDEFIRAEFNENEMGGKQIARSIHEVKGNDVWEVSINSHVRSGAIMEIGFNGFVELESGERLVMQDLQTGKILDVSTGMKHTIRYAAGYELRFMKGTASFIDEESQIDRLVVNELYPNPSNGLFNLDIVIPVSEQSSDMLVEVSDLSGKKVYSIDYQNAPSGAATMPLDLRGLSLRSGLYIVEISYIDSSTQKLYKKITKKGYLISDN